MKNVLLALAVAIACLTQACIGDEFTTGTGGASGSSAVGGSSGASGIGGSSGTGGNSGKAGHGGSSGTGGTIADAGDEDTAEVVDAAEEVTAPDSSDAAEEPDAPWPTSPCGAYPPTGYAICWVYEHPSYPNLLLGLAGGVAQPGHFIDNEWSDPMVGNAGNCVAPNGQQNHVLCTVDDQPIGTLVQFAAGLHQNLDAPTESSNWACGSQECYGEVHVYYNGTEIGKYVGGQGFGKLHTIPHFTAASHIDLGFGVSL